MAELLEERFLLVVRSTPNASCCGRGAVGLAANSVQTQASFAGHLAVGRHLSHSPHSSHGSHYSLFLTFLQVAELLEERFLPAGRLPVVLLSAKEGRGTGGLLDAVTDAYSKWNKK